MPAGLHCLGAALVDYEFLVTEEQLRKLEIERGLMTLIDLEQFHHYYDNLHALAESARAGGGSAVNSLVTFVRLGGKGSLCCMVGEDECADFFQREIQSLGIEDHSQTSAAQPTGRCLALITPDGERTMLTHLGINTQLATAPPRTLRADDFFYSESYLLAIEKPRHTLMQHITAARRQGLRVAVNLSDVSMTRHFRSQLHDLLQDGVDLLFGNRDEYYDYTAQQDIKSVYACLRERVGTLVMTAGAEGSWVCQSERIMHIPSLRTRLRDSLGAGDTYAGAYLYALEKKADHRRAAKFASAAAARVVSRVGSRLNQQECRILRERL